MGKVQDFYDRWVVQQESREVGTTSSSAVSVPRTGGGLLQRYKCRSSVFESAVFREPINAFSQVQNLNFSRLPQKAWPERDARVGLLWRPDLHLGPPAWNRQHKIPVWGVPKPVDNPPIVPPALQVLRKRKNGPTLGSTVQAFHKLKTLDQHHNRKSCNPRTTRALDEQLIASDEPHIKVGTLRRKLDATALESEAEKLESETVAQIESSSRSLPNPPDFEAKVVV